MFRSHSSFALLTASEMHGLFYIPDGPTSVRDALEGRLSNTHLL
jgi:hypothetical protein